MKSSVEVNVPVIQDLKLTATPPFLVERNYGDGTGGSVWMITSRSHNRQCTGVKISNEKCSGRSDIGIILNFIDLTEDCYSYLPPGMVVKLEN